MSGYLRHRELPPLERRLLRVTVAARYAQSLVRVCRQSSELVWHLPMSR